MEIERVFFKFPPSPTKGEKMICGPRKKKHLQGVINSIRRQIQWKKYSGIIVFNIKPIRLRYD